MKIYLLFIITSERICCATESPCPRLAKGTRAGGRTRQLEKTRRTACRTAAIAAAMADAASKKTPAKRKVKDVGFEESEDSPVKKLNTSSSSSPEGLVAVLVPEKDLLVIDDLRSGAQFLTNMVSYKRVELPREKRSALFFEESDGAGAVAEVMGARGIKLFSPCQMHPVGTRFG